MEGLPKNEFEKLGVIVSRVVDLACQLPEATDRHGAYFCLADGDTGLPKLLMLVGSVSVIKAPKYLQFAQEKARRLSLHEDHRTSRESRDPEKDQYGGAVYVNGDIFSLSGLPERLDEAVVIVVASLVGDLSEKEIRVRAGMHTDDPNPFFDSFIKLHARFS